MGVASEQAPPPPLTILSLSMKTMLNTRTKTNEVYNPTISDIVTVLYSVLCQVLCMGALVHKDVFLDKPPSTPFQSDLCG